MLGYQHSQGLESEGILLVDTNTPNWNMMFQNEAWLRITGMSRLDVHGNGLWQLFVPAGQTKVQAKTLQIPACDHHAAAGEIAMPKCNCMAMHSHTVPAVTQNSMLREILLDAGTMPKRPCTVRLCLLWQCLFAGFPSLSSKHIS